MQCLDGEGFNDWNTGLCNQGNLKGNGFSNVNEDGSFPEHENRDAHENGASDDPVYGNIANAAHGIAGTH